MDQDVSEGDDPLLLRDSPCGIRVVLGEPAKSLADNLELPLNARAKQRIRLVIGKRLVLTELLEILGGLKNIALYQGKLREAIERERHYIAATRLIAFDGKDHWILENTMARFFEDMYSLSKDQQWLDSAEAMRPKVRAAWTADTSSGKGTPFYDNIWYRLASHDFPAVDSMIQEQVARFDTTNVRNQSFYWNVRFNCSYEKGHYDTAVYYGKLRILFDPSFTELVDLGRAQLVAGEISAAVTNLERASNQFDQDRIFPAWAVVSVYYWLGRAYEASGWNDKAVEQYQKVCDIWKDADPGILDHEDAKTRLASLTS